MRAIWSAVPSADAVTSHVSPRSLDASPTRWQARAHAPAPAPAATAALTAGPAAAYSLHSRPPEPERPARRREALQNQTLMSRVGEQREARVRCVAL